MRANEQRLRQVVLNLLSNAVKYNRSGGTVIVRINASTEGLIRIEISDTGGGIAPGDVPKLFESFERLQAGQTCVKGTGLGLVISKKLVEAMGGSIGADSVEGSGSTFWVQLRSSPVISDSFSVEVGPAEIPHLANA